ncbi:iron(3+)-hydroxamate-binding protein YxeB [Cohnella xylanilytica]|uniref:ABC transporter substrate-binding protein n=1 Tax=Cohnella xylanilytica TaxID=557555 RepID=A0A841TXK9_9BACL|nr:ABC transporter substrate-binding protein [Cohnella xylanilytica]MBB6692945.1 ABC transporter substrate-binding protein [Cohnella xylanilytica]GIO11788.1 iron(3+)-hydroxamate-binding protein YxeB [Cohnella xylanilytica]
MHAKSSILSSKFKSISKWLSLPLLLLLSLTVSACGGSASDNEPSASASASSSPSASPESPSPSASASASSDSAAEGFRIYKTDKGDIRIPVKPQRIVTDYYGGELLSVGANVVGVEPTAFANPFIKDRLKDAKDVGAEVDPEKALALQPDLIVVMYDANYEALSKVAPTVHIPYGTATDIYETVRLFGDLVGAPDKGEAFLADFDKKAAEGREKIKGVVDENATVGLYELTDKGELWIFGDNAGRGGQAVYNALKLKLPEKVKGDNQTVQISLETLPDYAADYMFLTTYDPEKKGDQLAKLKESPIWKNVPAVRNNRAFFNDFDTFYRYDPIAVTAQIDLFVDMLLQAGK